MGLVDLISVVLGSISILQNIKLKQGRAERVSSLKDAMRDVGKVHDCLAEAKDIHDEFEIFMTTGIVPNFHSIRGNRSSMQAIKSNLDTLLQIEAARISTRELTFTMSTPPNDDLNPVRDSLRKLSAIYPELAASLQGYRHIVAEIEKISKDQAFGPALDEKMAVLEDRVRRVTNNVDKIILNVVPILRYLHSEQFKAMDDLL